jgi:hypothetical protein
MAYDNSTAPSPGDSPEWSDSVAEPTQKMSKRDGLVARLFGPEKTMIGVLVVAVVLYLMPTILSKVGSAASNDISGPLANVSSGQEAVGIIEFGWLVPLLMIVFMVFTYLRQAQ